MAAEMHVSVITVKHAYELLCDEGYVEARERSGYYVIFRKEDGFESEFSLSSKPEETMFALSGEDNVIYMNTFTLTLSPPPFEWDIW